MSGTTAAAASSSAKRVARCRILRAISRSPLVSVRGALVCSRFPEAQRRQHIAVGFDGYFKTTTDGADAFSPRQKHGRRIVDDRPLKIQNRRRVFGVVPGITNRIERRIDLGAREPAVV